MDSPDQVGDFIIALANGCLAAGVPPRKMTPPMSIDNLPPKLRQFSFADKVVFVGAVAGVVPPVGCTGVEMVANEMEGELAMAGIKEGRQVDAGRLPEPLHIHRLRHHARWTYHERCRP